MIPVLFGVSIIVFSLTRMGGDPVAAYVTPHTTQAQIEQIKSSLHLDDTLPVQYFYWLGSVLQGNWGYSSSNGYTPVLSTIIDRFPATLELTIAAMLIAMIGGTIWGTRSALGRDKPFDHGSRAVGLLLYSAPVFLLGIVLQYIFFFRLGWLPAGGQYNELLFINYAGGWRSYTGMFILDSILNGNMAMFVDSVLHIILPALTLGLGSMVLISRLVRSSMLEVLDQEFIKAARAKGLSENKVIIGHGLRNALLPTTTMVGLMFAGLLSGDVITEYVFQWPGIGGWAANAITSFDTPAIMGFVLFTAFLFLVINLAVDILYAYLDPRVRLE